MELLQFIQLVLLLVFSLASAAVCWFVYQYIEFHIRKLPPGPIVGLPFLGFIPFVDGEPLKEFYELSKKYGPLLSFSLGFYRVVMVYNYEYAKEILNHPACIGRPDAVFSFFPSRGGFLGMTGEEWQEQRRFCIHALRNLGIGKGPWEKIIQGDADEFVEYLHKWNGKPVDVSGPLLRSGISSNTALLIGRRFSKKETNPDVLVTEKCHHAVTEHGKMSNPAALLPWLLKYLIKFNIAGYADKSKAVENFCNIFRKEIAKHQDCEDGLGTSDLIGSYLEALNKKDKTNGNKYYSVESLVGHMFALFLGGSDTTVASTSWLLVLMAEHPKVQEKVQQEVDDVFGRDGQISWDDRKKLPYTMATILEMERWACILPFYPPRSATETFEFHSYTIPKGSMIVVNTWTIHRDPKYWDNPDKFMPERFLESAEKNGKDPSKLDGLAIFSFGRRNCPGETVAMMTIFLYFASIMQKFAVRTPPGRRANLKPQYSGIMHPQRQELCFIGR